MRSSTMRPMSPSPPRVRRAGVPLDAALFIHPCRSDPVGAGTFRVLQLLRRDLGQATVQGLIEPEEAAVAPPSHALLAQALQDGVGGGTAGAQQSGDQLLVRGAGQDRICRDALLEPPV